jgi:hypothetical protein
LALLVSTATLAQQQSSVAPPLSPEDEIKTLQVQEGFRVVPVLTEPVIHEPSAIAWDGNGRMYVVEMRTYMQDVDGKGKASPDKMGFMLAPPLAGSPRVQGDKDRLLRIALKGLIGPIDGKTYAGLMLVMQANDDKWIGDVNEGGEKRLNELKKAQQGE